MILMDWAMSSRSPIQAIAREKDPLELTKYSVN
jgi:hypothetical protein